MKTPDIARRAESSPAPVAPAADSGAKSRPDAGGLRPDASAVLLAGGQSRRMGQPKVWLKFDGRPLLVHLVERLRTRFPDVVVVAAPRQALPETAARVVWDELPGEGPLAGLAVGLRESRQPLVFVSSCDAPFLNMDVAEYLLNVAACYDIVVPEVDGRRHPLHAVYRTTLLPAVEELLAAGVRRPMALFERARTAFVSGSELRTLDPDGRTFLNMNTPEDYAAALVLWEQGAAADPAPPG